MINQLKKILFNIARLPAEDQHWIVQHLSSIELKKLNQCCGLKLLKEAQRFRTLRSDDACLPLKKAPPPLPELCQHLALKAPLYAAIILEQGSYPWMAIFLKEFDIDGVIQALLENQVVDIKEVVKQAVFSEWERSVSFDSLLDETHG